MIIPKPSVKYQYILVFLSSLLFLFIIPSLVNFCCTLYITMSSFSSIPILDLSAARDPETKPAFLKELRHALLEVGFLYLKNIGIPEELTKNVIEEGIAFFDIPFEEK
jgi:hypothetical protein